MESCPAEIDEGLTLFQHMRAREHRKYLDCCNDDIEEIKYDDGLSTFRISGSTPTRSGGLLVYDAEKNDYDWLLTPPGTPLFPSLDQEAAGVNLSQRASFTHSASASKLLKEPPLKGPSGALLTRNTPACAYTTPSPQRAKAASPSRTSASSSKARSPSPSPSSTRSHTSTRAFSPCRSVTSTGQSPARANKSASKSPTSTLCQNSMSPLLTGGPGYSARRGPRRSLSPRLGPWEPVMAACSSEPPPNLRTSPSNRSLQRGTAEGSGKGSSFRIGGSSQETVLNGNGPKSRTVSADNIESYSFSNRFKQTSKNSPNAKTEIDVRQNISKGPNIPAVSTTISLGENSGNGSYVRREAPVSTRTKEVISDFANEKLIERQMSDGRSLHMFRPLMSSAHTTSYGKTKPEPSKETCKIKLVEEAVSACARIENQMLIIKQLRNDIACREPETALPGNPESNVEMKGMNLVSEDSHQRHRTHALHSILGENQMLNIISNREKISEHGREDHRFFNNKSQSSPRNKFNKVLLEPAYESLSPQAFKTRSSGSPHGARLPVRRQLSMANSDMVYGTWSMKKTESFDISTSDSYSCSESLDSSYIDNRTEKFSEDLSEVDSMSHTGYSNSNSSATNHSLRNLIFLEKPFSGMSTDIEREQGKVLLSLPPNSGRAVFEASKLLKENSEKEQGRQARSQSSSMDSCQSHMPSFDYQNRVYGSDGLSLEDVHSFMESLDMKRRQSTAQILYTSLDVKGKHPATGLNLNAWNRGHELHSVKSEFASGATEESGWDDSCKQMQPQASPLKRNVTLEEATDTILFCSSIVHEMVYEAATLGEEKCIMSSAEDPCKAYGLMCRVESSRSSPCWSWNRRRTPLRNVAHEAVNDETMVPNTQLCSRVLPSPHKAGGDLQQKRKKKCGLCCFN